MTDRLIILLLIPLLALCFVGGFVDAFFTPSPVRVDGLQPVNREIVEMVKRQR